MDLALLPRALVTIIPAATTLPIDAHGRRLMRHVGELRTRATLERSFRLRPGALHTNRFMFSLAREPLGPDGSERIAVLASRLGMADGLLDEVRRYLPMVPYVHPGYEGDGESSLYKLCLEFGAQCESIAADDPAPHHFAFKWWVDDPDRHVVSRYFWHPKLSAREIDARVADHFAGPGLAVPRDVARSLLAVAADRVSPDALHYLEVAEPGNVRRSFELNLYDADLRLPDVYPWFARITEHFAIGPGRFNPFFATNATTSLGHVAAGVHRDGEPFFNVSYNVVKKQAEAPRVAPASLDCSKPLKKAAPSTPRLNAFALPDPPRAASDPWEPTAPGDRYLNYCLWPYEPAAPTEGKLRALGLLNHSFEMAGLRERGRALIDALRSGIGPFQTVYGVKWADGQLGWEFYFYVYHRIGREVSITRVVDVLRPFAECAVPIDESIPYFMFWLDIDDSLLRGISTIDLIHAFIGNPGSAVSSGIPYALAPGGRTLEYLYSFFHAERDLQAAADKVRCSAHVDASRVRIDAILWPELRRCHTICVANKRGNDTAYFSGVEVDQLLFFLERLDYPDEIVQAIRRRPGGLDHLLIDVGFDYVVRRGELVVLSSRYNRTF